MGFVGLSQLIGLGGFIVWALVERGFSLLNQQQHQGRKQAQGSYWLISLFWYGTMLFSIWDAWGGGWTTFEVALRPARGVGVLLTLGGLTIRFLARRALGKEYSVHVETSDAHELVTRGLYRMVRHPAYLGLLCLFLGIPLSLGSWGGVGIAVVGGVPAVVYRIRVEEKALSEWFGKQYEQYKENSWRLVPYLW